MLDDLKYLNKVDKGDALGVAGKQADQLLHDFAASFQSKADIFNIVVGGMGGSGWPSLVLRSWPGLTVPFELSSNYHVPSYVNKSTLYIASSYSGNTEETLEKKNTRSTKYQVVFSRVCLHFSSLLHWYRFSSRLP